jgi:hypothetical protein
MPSARKSFFHTSKSRLSPLNFGSCTESIASASDALAKAPENQENCYQENHQVPVKRRATRLRKRDDKGLTEDAAVLPESIQLRQSETSLKSWSSNVVQECSCALGKTPFQKISRTTIGFHERRNAACKKLRERVKFQIAPS